jgi:hypothetical protein
MEKIVRLTESELKKIIMESVINILKEGQNDEPTNTHYAIYKPSQKIVFSWDYSGYDPAELRQFKKDYFETDLLDMEMNPREIAIWTRRNCMKNGIDPSDDANWSNYPIKESLLKEYGETDKGQEMLGRAAGRAQKRAQNIGRKNDFDKYCDAMGRADKIGNYARDQRIKSTGKPDDSTGAFTKGVKDGKQKEMNEAYNRHSTTIISIDLGGIEFPNQALNDFIDENYDNMPDCVEVEFEYEYIPYTPATYWQPAEGDEIEVYGIEVLADEFANIIPQELFTDFVDTIESYAETNCEDLIRNEDDFYDEGPDPDEAYERWRDSQYED